MRGSGTQTDPFIVDNWEDFVAAVGIAGAYVAFPEGGGVIDMSERGFFTATAVTLACAHINGNGWTIRGISWQDCALMVTATSNDVTINWLSFTDLNCIAYGNSASFIENNASSRTRLYGIEASKPCCVSGVFDGSVSSTRSAYVFNNNRTYGIYCDICAITIELKGYATLNYRSTYARLNNCNIKITGKVVEDYPYPLAGDFSYCYISGDVTVGVTTSLTSDEYIFGALGNSAYNIVDLTITNGAESTAKYVRFTGSGSAISLINKDKIIGFEDSWGSAAYATVTEEQLHDAAYLNSIGFAIGVES